MHPPYEDSNDIKSVAVREGGVSTLCSKDFLIIIICILKWWNWAGPNVHEGLIITTLLLDYSIIHDFLIMPAVLNWFLCRWQWTVAPKFWIYTAWLRVKPTRVVKLESRSL